MRERGRDERERERERERKSFFLFWGGGVEDEPAREREKREREKGKRERECFFDVISFFQTKSSSKCFSPCVLRLFFSREEKRRLCPFDTRGRTRQRRGYPSIEGKLALRSKSTTTTIDSATHLFFFFFSRAHTLSRSPPSRPLSRHASAHV